MLESEKKIILGDSVHSVLAHSYVSCFVSFLLGLFFHLLWPLRISDKSFLPLLGVVFLLFATSLIFWAQTTSKKLDRSNLSKETFSKGPYRYTRLPTHWGLLLLMAGFGLLVNSAFIVLFAVISFLVSKFFFLKREEAILLRKYGESYSQYKKAVKF